MRKAGMTDACSETAMCEGALPFLALEKGWVRSSVFRSFQSVHDKESLPLHLERPGGRHWGSNAKFGR